MDNLTKVRTLDVHKHQKIQSITRQKYYVLLKFENHIKLEKETNFFEIICLPKDYSSSGILNPTKRILLLQRLHWITNSSSSWPLTLVLIIL